MHNDLDLAKVAVIRLNECRNTLHQVQTLLHVLQYSIGNENPPLFDVYSLTEAAIHLSSLRAEELDDIITFFEAASHGQ